MRRGATLVFLGAVLAAIGVTTMPHRSNALGAGPVGYQLVAAADGVRVTWTVPNFAVIDSPVDGGGPSAQARLDSLGQSSAFASLPYPGDAFVGLPGLLAGFTGLPAAPAYPLYVRSSHPTVPDGNQEAPGVSLGAHSDAGSSVASAAGGAEGEAAVAHPVSRAETTRAGDGTLTAVASSAVDAVAVGPLTLRGLVSTARVVLTPDGRREITSSLSAASAAVGDLAAELNEQGLVVAGTAAPLGSPDPLAGALAEAGIRVELTEAAETESGVVAPSLSVTISQYSELIERPVTIRYLLGASSASAVRTAPAPLPAPEVNPPGESTVGPPEEPALAPSEPAASPTTPIPGGGSGAGVGSIGPTEPAGGDTGSGNTGQEAEPAPPPNLTPGGDRPPGAEQAFTPVVSESAGWAWGGLYLVVAAGGLVMAGGVELIRSSGVRKP